VTQKFDLVKSLKGAWSGHVKHLNFGGRQPYHYLERLIVSGAVSLAGRSVWLTGDGLGDQFITLTERFILKKETAGYVHLSPS